MMTLENDCCRSLNCLLRKRLKYRKYCSKTDLSNVKEYGEEQSSGGIRLHNVELKIADSQFRHDR